MKKYTFNQNAAIRGAIRRVFTRSPIIREVMMKVRKEFPKLNKDGRKAKKNAIKYLCNVCQQYIGSTKISVDHIIPVVSIEEGFIDWNTFVERLFCDITNLQVICDDCHQLKTNQERSKRTAIKDMQALDLLEQNIKNITKKEISKYLSRSKPQLIKDRASALLKNIKT